MKRFTAAALAAATAMSLAVAPAQAQQNDLVEAAKLVKILVEKGTGAAPDTEGAGKMMGGSVKAGSSAQEAYNATQAGWILTWIAVSVAGLGLIGYGAKAAGVLPPQLAGQLPF